MPPLQCRLWRLKNYRHAVKLYISQSSETAKIKMFIIYKRKIYALAHFISSNASCKCIEASAYFIYRENVTEIMH